MVMITSIGVYATQSIILLSGKKKESDYMDKLRNNYRYILSYFGILMCQYEKIES